MAVKNAISLPITHQKIVFNAYWQKIIQLQLKPSFYTIIVWNRGTGSVAALQPEIFSVQNSFLHCCQWSAEGF